MAREARHGATTSTARHSTGGRGTGWGRRGGERGGSSERACAVEPPIDPSELRPLGSPQYSMHWCGVVPFRETRQSRRPCTPVWHSRATVTRAKGKGDRKAVLCAVVCVFVIFFLWGFVFCCCCFFSSWCFGAWRFCFGGFLGFSCCCFF